jgi:hypothetical protein
MTGSDRKEQSVVGKGVGIVRPIGQPNRLYRTGNDRKNQSVIGESLCIVRKLSPGGQPATHRNRAEQSSA